MNKEFADAREREDWRGALAALGPAGSGSSETLALRHQVLVQLRRFREAFREGERFLDSSPKVFDMRTFWNPGAPDFRPPPSASGPWAQFYRATMAPGIGGLAALESARWLAAPRYRWMRLIVGRRHQLASNFGDALAHLKGASGSKPFDWRTHAVLGETLLCLGRRAQARRAFQKAVDASAAAGQRDQARAWQGEALLWAGQYRAAEKALAEGCAVSSPFGFSWRGAALLKLGRPEEALDCLARAAEVLPGDPEIPAWRAEALRALGREAEAVAVIGSGPVGAWARVNRALARASLGDRKGFAADFWDIPPRLIPDSASSFSGRRKILEKVLKRARGYRREEEYGEAVWRGRGRR